MADEETNDVPKHPLYGSFEHTHEANEPSVVVAQISGYTTEGKHETTIYNNWPSRVKVTLEHDGNETTITIEEIEDDC